MKNGDRELNSEELRDLVENYGFDAAEFFAVPKEIHHGWLIGASACFLVALLILVLAEGLNPKYVKALFVFGGFSALVAVVLTQLRFKNVWASGAVAAGGVLLLMVAFGALSPQQAFDSLKGVVDKK